MASLVSLKVRMSSRGAVTLVFTASKDKAVFEEHVLLPSKTAAVGTLVNRIWRVYDKDVARERMEKYPINTIVRVRKAGGFLVKPAGAS